MGSGERNAVRRNVMAGDIGANLVQLDRGKVMDEVETRIEAGESAVAIIEECRDAMALIGDKFKEGDFFLAELVLSGQIFKDICSLLQPHLARQNPSKEMGAVVLATLRGDIHDLGKDILATLLEARGFKVYNLGVDVDPNLVMAKVKEVRPDFVGFSCLLTTVFDVMKNTSQRLAESGLRDSCKLMIGGGVTTPQVKGYVGADFQSIDAMAGVNYCLQVMEGR